MMQLCCVYILLDIVDKRANSGSQGLHRLINDWPSVLGSTLAWAACLQHAAAMYTSIS